MDHPTTPVITEFVRQFCADHAAYEALSGQMESRLKALMAHKGIMALVSARVKEPERLEQKLCKRNAAREIPYRNQKEIFEDIPDLIGDFLESDSALLEHQNHI